MINNSEIIGIGTLHALIPALVQSRLAGYNYGGKQGWSKTDKLSKSFCILHNGKKFQNDCSFGVHLLTLLEIYFYFKLTLFDVFAGFVSDENKLLQKWSKQLFYKTFIRGFYLIEDILELNCNL